MCTSRGPVIGKHSLLGLLLLVRLEQLMPAKLVQEQGETRGLVARV